MCLLCCIMCVTFPVSEAPIPEGHPVLPSPVKREELRGGLVVHEPSGLGVCQPLKSICRILCMCPCAFFEGFSKGSLTPALKGNVFPGRAFYLPHDGTSHRSLFNLQASEF